MDLSAYSTRFGGSVSGFNVEEYLVRQGARKLDLFIQYGLAASFQAVSDSGLEVTDANRERIGVSMGSGIGGPIQYREQLPIPVRAGAAAHLAVLRARFDHQHGRWLPVDPPGSAAGPNYALTTACTTGTHSIGMAARNIVAGEADVMVAGAS